MHCLIVFNSILGQQCTQWQFNLLTAVTHLLHVAIIFTLEVSVNIIYDSILENVYCTVLSDFFQAYKTLLYITCKIPLPSWSKHNKYFSIIYCRNQISSICNLDVKLAIRDQFNALWKYAVAFLSARQNKLPNVTHIVLSPVIINFACDLFKVRASPILNTFTCWEEVLRSRKISLCYCWNNWKSWNIHLSNRQNLKKNTAYV